MNTILKQYTMKKHLLLLTTIFALLFSNVFSQTVYVTKSGKKYHSASCHYLAKSKIEISLADAQAKGYTPCSVCGGASSTTQNAPSPNSNQNQSYTPPPPKQSSSTQCTAITKAGNRCSRMTNSPNGKCWQHGGN